MRRIVLAAVVLLALGVTACDSSSSDRSDRPAPPAPRTEPAPPEDEPAPPVPDPSRAERLIQAWLGALELGDYERAASYFARGALVDQGDPHRLATRADAIAFNASLPCRARLADLHRERRTVLARFLLVSGPGGPCGGSVRVRFTIRDGHFTVFRQLLEDPTVPSVEA